MKDRWIQSKELRVLSVGRMMDGFLAGRDSLTDRARTLGSPLRRGRILSGPIWSAPAERSGDGALALTSRRGSIPRQSKAGSRFAYPALQRPLALAQAVL